MTDRQKKFVLILLVCLGLLGYGGYTRYQENYPKYVKALTEKELEAGTLKVKVHISVDTIEYYSLGKDLSVRTWCNGRRIEDGDIVTARPEMKFKTEIKEIDSIPDVNSGSMVMKMPPAKQSRSQRIKVCEEGGRRYPDAYAIYRVGYDTEPVLKNYHIHFWNVLFMR